MRKQEKLTTRGALLGLLESSAVQLLEEKNDVRGGGRGEGER